MMYQFIGGCHKKQIRSSKNYMSWNKDMDAHLAKVLIDQMAQETNVMEIRGNPSFASGCDVSRFQNASSVN